MVLDQFSLYGKAVIVTGGEGLLGKIICQTVKELNGDPISVDVDKHARFVCDVGSNHACWELAKAFPQARVIVNAAIRNQKPVVAFEEGWDADLHTGLTGAMNVIRAFEEHLIRNKGVILNIGSDLSLIAPDNSLYPKGMVKPLSYSVIKHGIVGMTRYFAAYFGDKVRVNCLCPGGIDQGQKVPSSPMNRLARAEEMAGPVAFLISEASSFMTGAVISVDGGRTAI